MSDNCSVCARPWKQHSQASVMFCSQIAGERADKAIAEMNANKGNPTMSMDYWAKVLQERDELKEDQAKQWTTARSIRDAMVERLKDADYNVMNLTKQRDEWKAEAESLRERLRDALSKEVCKCDEKYVEGERNPAEVGVGSVEAEMQGLRVRLVDSYRRAKTTADLLKGIWEAHQWAREKLGFEQENIAGEYRVIPDILRKDAEALAETLELCCQKQAEAAQQCPHGFYHCFKCARQD